MDQLLNAASEAYAAVAVNRLKAFEDAQPPPPKVVVTPAADRAGSGGAAGAGAVPVTVC